MSLQYMISTPQEFHVQEQTDLEFLDEVYELIRSGAVDAGMDKLERNLHYLYLSTSNSEWKHLADSALLAHPLHDLLMQDPVTARAFAQPRGYAGDAVLLDLIYFPNRADLSLTTTLGREIFKYTTRTGICRALRRRMKAVSDYIDDFSSNVQNAKVLSVASGHCREASSSTALKSGALGRFVALDHDPESLSVMQRDYSSLGLEAMPLSVQEIIKGKTDIGKFDLIYSSGLFDYLSTKFSQKLIERLFDMLTPRGRLVLINIASDYEEIGYLESYMNWSMIGRSQLDTLELAASLKTNTRASLNIRELGNISSHYQVLEIVKN